MDKKLLDEYKFMDTPEMRPDNYSHSNEQNGLNHLLNYVLNNDD